MNLENKTSNRKYSMAILYYNYAQVYYQLKESNKALEYAKKSLDEAVNFNVISQKIDPANLLRNIYKELESNNVNFVNPDHGNLVTWAKQGVLLLNSVLTVERQSPAAHANKGSEVFTDHVISLLNNHKNNLVFILWGAYANKKSELIDSSKHLILSAPHPSPFSAHKGFLGSQHFLKTNEYLESTNQNPIDWRIPK